MITGDVILLLADHSISCSFEDNEACGYRNKFIDTFYLWRWIVSDENGYVPDYDINFPDTKKRGRCTSG